MRQLSLEAFQSMIETDPIPHVLINACKNKDSVIPFVLESTKIVTEEEWKDELVPEDGCGIVITDSDGVCPIDHLEHGRTIAWFDVRTKAGEEKFELPWKVCEEVIKEGDKNYVVDIRRKDEVEHFGSADFTIKKPLHELLHDVTHGDGIAQILEVGTENEPEKPIIVFCRTNRRAKFCVQLLHDANVRNVSFVKKGAVGLSENKDLHMHAYNSFEVGEEFPEALN
eukprot:m.158619 g.158619  ORF g.158619 m.158619 type:complete len:226 (-) comp13356_c0_seq4:5185-5862(-)